MEKYVDYEDLLLKYINDDKYSNFINKYFTNLLSWNIISNICFLFNLILRLKNMK